MIAQAWAGRWDANVGLLLGTKHAQEPPAARREQTPGSFSSTLPKGDGQVSGSAHALPRREPREDAPAWLRSQRSTRLPTC